MKVLSAAACSNTGKRRRNNEDNFCLNGVYMAEDTRDAGTLMDCETEENALFAVCDGMGGQEAGEDASLLACKCCAELQTTLSASQAQDPDLYGFLKDGCMRVLQQSQQSENNAGSTIALLLSHHKGFVVANMGDSRIYRLTQEGLVQVSKDHTEVMRLLDQGEITPSEIKTHPRRHMILQYFGMPLGIAPFQPYISQPIAFVNGEKYLLCSDGLTDMLEDVQIEAILTQPLPPREIAQNLVQEALNHGGRDNVTVIVVSVSEENEETVRSDPHPKKKHMLRTVLLTLLVIGFAITVYFCSIRFLKG